MINIDELYFDWLMDKLGDTTPQFERMCWIVHQQTFTRRIGNDVNRATDGINLRKACIRDYEEHNMAPSITNNLLRQECSWLEMLIALADGLDYLYDGGIKERFLELITNLGLLKVIFSVIRKDGTSRYDTVDQMLVESVTRRVNNNQIAANGAGGLFPLKKTPPEDQREVEIWQQHAAYFNELLEGVLWTSTN